MRRSLGCVTAYLVAVGLTVSCASLDGLSGAPASDGGMPDGSAACGKVGETCCDGHSCSGGLSCSAGTCSSGPTSGDDAGRESGRADARGDSASHGDASVKAEAGSGGCSIAGNVYATASVNPANPCEACEPPLSTSAWSDAPDGTTCGSGGICHTGACVSGCEIAGVYFGATAANPDDPCESCQPGKDITAWSTSPDGTNCGNGQVCATGMCGTQCDITGSGIVTSGAPNPANVCQGCEPGTSTTTWTDYSDGTSCGTSVVCSGGGCVSGCFIDDVVYVPGAGNPSNACESCQPAATATDWTPVAAGSSCAPGEVCRGATCEAACFIDGAVVTSGATASGGCKVCQPASSTSTWTTGADGTACDGALGVCSGGTCAVTFAATSPQAFTVPAGATAVTITATGAQGGSCPTATAPGGLGASVTATISTTPGEALTVTAGGSGTCAAAGANGGGKGGLMAEYVGAGGGGASDVRQGGAALANRVVVAAGGGGTSSNCVGTLGECGGGAGGTSVGTLGENGNAGAQGGGGGTPSAGGSGGVAGTGAGPGATGALGLGGNGGVGAATSGGGGGGGAGYYGGGGGGACPSGGGGPAAGAGGGGGSSYASTSATGVVMGGGVQAGAGSVVIRW